MLKVFTLRREGFNESVEVGEVFDFNEEKYVIIKINKLSKGYSQSIVMRLEVIAQQVGKISDYGKYERYSEFTSRYKNGEATYENPIYKVGETISYKGGIVGSITGISSMKYDFIDLVMTYQTELVRPWSQEEIQAAVKEKKLSIFKVISGGDR